ncbi:MAG: 50S ribosomal protein L9 [Chlamydiae bacterium]|nr:50S ribosomal protein L9 [Chlamydiota bacterium]
MAIKLLLTSDVDDLGRSGDVVSVKSGYARNFLLPRGVAVFADKNAFRMQAKLQEERAKRATEDLKEAEALAKRLQDVTLTAIVKIDQEGHMYGSVSVLDIVDLLKDQQNVEIEKRFVLLKNPIKTTGIHTVGLKFKEDVEASLILKVTPEEVNGTKPPKGPEVKEKEKTEEE